MSVAIRNCNREFDSSDLVAAFQAGSYVTRNHRGEIAAAISALLVDEDDITVDNRAVRG